MFSLSYGALSPSLAHLQFRALACALFPLLLVLSK